MRDLSRAAGMSLAGLYHYFGSKERLLYLIQKHTFTTILERLKERLSCSADPEQQIRIFILNHLEYFLANQEGMKVLSHEAESLTGERLEEVRALKKAYVELCMGLLAALDAHDGGPGAGHRPNRHVAAYTLFGMINWIYTWYDPQGVVGVEELADTICRLFLTGYAAEAHVR